MNRDQSEQLALAIGVGVNLWLLWLMTPAHLRERARAELAARLAPALRARRLAAQRRRVALQMEFEVFAALEALRGYDGHRDHRQLAADLETAAAAAP